MAPHLERVVADGIEFQRASFEFHEAIYSLSDNPVLGLLTRAVTHTITHHALLRLESVELFETFSIEHVRLAELIIEGCGAQAAELMHNHFAHQHDVLRRNVPALGGDVIAWR